ncbi:hypothetical protein Trydic_g23458 [Trypoxylus dichotomus]
MRRSDVISRYTWEIERVCPSQIWKIGCLESFSSFETANKLFRRSSLELVQMCCNDILSRYTSTWETEQSLFTSNLEN